MTGAGWLQKLLASLVSTGTVTTGSAEGGGLQKLQVAAHGYGSALTDPVPSLQQPGIASAPMPGAYVVMLHLGGDRSKPVVVAMDDPRHRPTDLAAGETKLYGASGAFVHIDAAGNVTIQTSGHVTINGDLRVTGAVTAGYGGGDAVGLQTHTHPTPAGQSSAPTAGT